jgi:hypothetical protein
MKSPIRETSQYPALNQVSDKAEFESFAARSENFDDWAAAVITREKLRNRVINNTTIIF